MNDDTRLSGRSVLVVEDDFYLAEDARDALEEAGANVLGPYGRADEALNSLEEHVPDCAVVDLNLGFGPNFEVARALKLRGVPILLVTGYDPNTIPPDLAAIASLQKPISRAKLTAAVADLLN
jgi:DNA-binding response OmpR family regulator